MQPDASSLFYFNSRADDKCRQRMFTILADTWEKIPDKDHQEIDDLLDLIIVRPVTDSGYLDTPAFTRAAPTHSGQKSYITWNTACLHHKSHETDVFILAHELAHVFLKHPQRGANRTKKEDKEIFTDISEAEAEYQTLVVWGIRPALDDEKLAKERVERIATKYKNAVGELHRNPAINDGSENYLLPYSQLLDIGEKLMAVLNSFGSVGIE